MSDSPEGRIIELLLRHGATVACAESLTGGLVCATLTGIPGASRVVRGGVVAYATDLKHELLHVPADLLAERGAVDADVAAAMAAGVARVCEATYGVATTGVAGPAGQDGHAPGTVHVAVHGPRAALVRSMRLSGDRSSIRRATVEAALELLLGGLTE